MNPTSEPSKKKLLLIKLCIFFIPIIFLIMLIAGLAFYMGEIMPLSLVVDLQRNLDFTISTKQVNTYLVTYKLLSAKSRNPEVLIVGSSRMLTFRSELFHKQPDAIYNMAIPATLASSIATFLQSDLDGIQPTIIIWGLDQPWFNTQFDSWWDDQSFIETYPTLDELYHWSIDTAGTVLEEKSKLITAFCNPLICGADNTSAFLGLNAITYHGGYRRDGSRNWGDNHIDDDVLWDYEFYVWSDQSHEYQHGDTVSDEKLALIDTTLASLSQRGITVIGLFPPYSTSLYSEMTKSENYSYIPKAAIALEDIFAKYDFAFFDFSDSASVGSSDAEMIDTWHPSDKVATRMYLAILNEIPEYFVDYSEVDTIEEYLENSQHPRIIFEDDYPDFQAD